MSSTRKFDNLDASINIVDPSDPTKKLVFDLSAISSGVTRTLNVADASGTIGDVAGPGSSTDNTVVRFDGTTGKILQTSSVVIDDSNNISGVVNISVSGTVDGRDIAADAAHFTNTSNPHSVTKAQVGLGDVPNLKQNLAASVAPVATDDSGSGYAVGSRWIDTTADKEYVCLDATATSAVWTETTGAGGAGETNTASSAGGTSLVKTKVGVDLPFKGLTATSTKIALAANTNDVGIDVVPANINIGDLNGLLDATKIADGSVTNVEFQKLNTLHKSYDAVVDAAGNADYTTVKAAFDAGAITVYVLNGTYVETGHINIPDNGRLLGETIDGVVIDFNNAAYSVQADAGATQETAGTISVTNGSSTVTGSGTTFTNLIAGDHLRIESVYYEIANVATATSLTIVGTYRGETKSGLAWTGRSMLTDIHVSNISIVNSTSRGIFMQGVLRGTIKDVLIRNCGNVSGVDCIFVNSSNRCGFINVRVDRGPRDGFTMQDSRMVKLYSCMITQMGRNGFQIYNADEVTFDGCFASQNQNDGFTVLNTSARTIISNCQSNGNSGKGINIDNTITDAVVTGCVVWDNVGNGIDVSGNNCIVSGNRVNSNTGNGINIVAGATGTVVSNNDFSGNTGTDFADSGTGTIKSSNSDGLVDGRDVSTDGSTLDAHVALTNEHLDWTADAGASNIHDANILASSVTQHEGSITHQNLSGAGTNTHAQIDSHISGTSNPHSVTAVQVGLGDVPNLKQNLAASAAPVATDDSGSGYAVGSRWIDTTADKEYVCLDATATSAVWTETTQSGGGGDHGGLTGLADDDHTQYMLLAGRAGGQTLQGGTAAGEDLTLESTSNASKGTIIALNPIEVDDIDARTATTLLLGKATATKVEIADTGIVTEIQGNLDALEGLDVTGNITVTGTVDGRDIAVDGTALDNHTAATAAHGATGAVVGTTNTQTLTNKTLTSPVLTTPQINDTSADHQYIFAVSELTLDRTVTLPLLTGNDTFVFESHTQTLANKTLTLPQINDTSTDHQYIFGVSELVADRTVTLPLLTGNDEFTFNDHTQTLTNKTIDTANNTLTVAAGDVTSGTFADARIAASNVTQHEGSLTLQNLGGTLTVAKGGTGATTLTQDGWLIGNGTGAVTAIKNNMGAAVAPVAGTDDVSLGYAVGSRWFDTTADKEYVCLDNTDGAAVWVETTAGAAGGETNTASSAGGTSLVKAKVGVDLPFKGLTATSSKIALASNTNDIGIDVTEANLTLDNLGGTLGVTKGGTGATTLTQDGILVGAGTGAIIAKKSNWAASVAPTSTDDSGSGYAVGSRWIDTTADKEYVCLDATATSAVWTETTGGGGGSLPTTTKGDLVVHNGSTDVRLAVGANDSVLIADSAEASGVKWGTLVSSDTDLPIVTVSRSSGMAGTGGFQKITWDTTTDETDPAKIEHNNTTISRIDYKEAGIAYVSHSLNFERASGTTTVLIQIEILKNGVAIANSRKEHNMHSSVAIGDKFVVTSTRLISVAANDYIEIQWNGTVAATLNNTSTSSFSLLKSTIGPQGPQGPQGIAGVDGDITWQNAWATSTVYTANQAVEHNGSSYVCISSHTSSASDEPGVGGSWATYWDLMASKGDPGPAITTTEVSATADTSTTSATYVVINSMTTTPAAGDYVVSFSTSGVISSNGAVGHIAIFVGGTVNAASERETSAAGSHFAGSNTHYYTQAKVTVNGSQAIDIRYKITTGTYTMHERNMILTKVT